MARKKQIPKFKNEEEERAFWDAHDSTEYLDWANGQARHIVQSETINMRQSSVLLTR